MYYVGLDVHQERSSVCILDAHGKLVKEFTVLGCWDRLLEELAKLPQPMAVCFEASTGCGWLYEKIRAFVARVEVAHPGQLRLIFKSKRKHDRVDARKLAKLLFLDEVPRAYIPAAPVRAWRALVEFRCTTVDKRTMAKNALRTLLRGCGIQNLQAARALWGLKGLAFLRAIELPAFSDRLRRDQLLAELDLYQGQIKTLEKELDRIAQDHPQVAFLQGIPGVGPRTAEAVLAYIDKAERFSRNKQIGAYFGLVPCQDASAGSNRLGHITREGPPTIRKLLIEATWQGIRHSPTIRAYYDRVCQGRKERRKIALVATAHYLLRVMHAMLRTGEVWRETVTQEEKTSP
jgi:transposase